MAIREDKIEPGEEQDPTHMYGIESFDSVDVLQIFVMGPDWEWLNILPQAIALTFH